MNTIMKCLAVLVLSMSLLGCRKPPVPETPPAEVVVHDIAAYFPIEAGLTWVFQGEGSEYADFTRRVAFRQDNRAQIIEANGGTKMAMVFRISPQEATRTFFIPEFYTERNILSSPDNTAETFLKAPLKAGASWVDEKNKREVVGLREKVTVPAGTFSDVVVIKVSPIHGDVQSSRLIEYYAPNTGLILREFTSGENFKVTSKLKFFGKQSLAE